jgi:RNA polymerase sigma-B factor
VRPRRGVLELSLSVVQARERLNSAVGREPTVADLAERFGRSPEQVEEALQAAEGRSARSLDTPVQEDEQEAATAGDLIGGNDPGYDRAEARATIERLIAILDDRAREVLRLRFEDDLLQSEIAERVGCSQMHVSRIIRSALDQLYVQSRSTAVGITRRSAAPA